MPVKKRNEMIRIIVATVVITAGFVIMDTPANAAKDGDKCHDAWVDRNSVYANKNYCFRTAKAKDFFGPNASNCKKKVKLSAGDWRKINAAKKRERKYC